MVDRIGESLVRADVQLSIVKQAEPVEAAVPKEPAEQGIPVKEEELQKFADQLTSLLQPTFTHVKFEYHDKLKEYYVVLIDKESKEIIKEIPEKKMLDMYASMKEFIGLLFDRKA